MKTLLPAIYLANRNQMVKEADMAGLLGRGLGYAFRGGAAAPGLARRGLAATARGVEAMPGLARQGLRSTAQFVENMPGRVARGPVGNAYRSGVANFREGAGFSLSPDQAWLRMTQRGDQFARSQTPWLQRSVGFNSNGLATLAGTGAVGAGVSGWNSHQLGSDWGQQTLQAGRGMAPSFHMPGIQSPVQMSVRSPFKSASWTGHWVKVAGTPLQTGIQIAMQKTAPALGAAGKALTPAMEAAKQSLPYLMPHRSWLKHTPEAIRPYAMGALTSGPGRWIQDNPGTSGLIAGAGLMRGGEYARNTVRENRIANLSPMERLMMVGGLIFNPQSVASRLY